MADAPDSKSGPRKGVWVQVPPSVLTLATPQGGGFSAGRDRPDRPGPVHPVARVLKVLEALLGQIYLVTYLALIVGNFSSQRIASRVERARAAMPSSDLGVERRGAEDGIRNRAATDAAGGGREGTLHHDIPTPLER